METVKGQGPTDRNNPLDAEMSVEEPVRAADAAVEAETAVIPELPLQPPLVWQSQDVADAAEHLRRLLHFHLYGRRDLEGVPESSDDLTIPALLYQYQDLSHLRYDYPLCLNSSDPDQAVRPLTQVVDDAIAQLTADDSDDGERRKRHVYQLESVVRALAETKHDASLAELVDEAAERVLSSSRLSGDKKDRLKDDVSRAREALQRDDRVISCHPRTAGQLLAALATANWMKSSAAWRDEVESLIQRLQDILTADFNRSPQARSPKRLRESVGERAGQDIDFAEMSTILRETEPSPRLTKDRRARVQKSLSVLLDMSPLFELAMGEADNDTPMPFRVDEVTGDCETAFERHASRMDRMVTFFKAVRIARLEVENGYREEVHDRFFDGFDAECLTEEELALYPPVLVSLEGDGLAEVDAKALLEILSSGSPIKVLCQVEDIFTGGESNGTGPIRVGWQAHLASMAVALGNVYVLQAPISQQSAVYEGLAQGLRCEGPALFSVYVGGNRSRPALSTFLDAAAAAESRLFPVLTFDPGKGDTLAERMSVLENPQNDRDWPTDTFAFRTADGEESEVELGFTAADFIFCDKRFSEYFWCPPPNAWHESMVPLHAYLRDTEAADTSIPYVLTVDGRGQLGRAVMTRAVVKAVWRCASSWRHLQETGGINNSFALDLLEKEKQRLIEEKREEMQAIEKNYVAQMDQDLGELTKEIVQRIANRLIAEAGEGTEAGGLPFAMPTAAPADRPAVVEPPPAQEVAKEAVEEVEKEEEEEDEEVATLDDPYIDTPLCTSCNECTQLNAQMFAYNSNKQAFIKDPRGGPYKDLVRAAELCPVRIIHPGKPKDSSEPGMDELLQRAKPFM